MDDICPTCAAALWKPHADFPDIMHRYVHLHEGKKLTEILVIREVDWTLTEKEAKKHARITPNQEWAIERILQEKRTPENPEGSDGALLADDMGVGKTLQLTEVVLRGGFKRALIIGLPDTHDQIRERVYAQSYGTVLPRVMNGTAKGKANHAAFLAGEDGIFIGGSAFFVAQDFHSVLQFEVIDGVSKPKWEIDKKTGHPKTRPLEDGMHGPESPIQVRKSEHKAIYRRKLKKHPLDFIGFDEVQAIANKFSQARRTVRSMGDAFKLAMSGTWFLNTPDNMWSVTRWVWPGVDPVTGDDYVITNHDVWKSVYMSRVPVLKEDGTPLLRTNHLGQKVAILETSGEREPGAFTATLPCYIRREADDPIPKPLELYVDPTEIQAAQLEELKRDLMTWVMTWQGDEEPLVTDLPPELHTRMRQATIAELSIGVDGKVNFHPDSASAKLSPLRYLLEERWAGLPVGIGTDSKIGAYFIVERLRRAGVDARAWTGDLSRGARAELKRAFMAGEFRVLVSTIQSFGVGLDGFQKVCDKVAWISDLEGSPAINDQFIRRYIRPGRLLRDGRDQFEHARILMRNSVDVDSFAKLVSQGWNMRASLMAPAA